MYEKILVAVDHSDVTPRVLDAARGLAALSQGEVWVIHLREHESMGRFGPVTPSEPAEAAGADVTSTVEALIKAGITAHGVVRDALYGHAAQEIVSEARDRGADVIVMGSRGRGDLAGLILGSTAHKVIHLADRQVLVIR